MVKGQMTNIMSNYCVIYTCTDDFVEQNTCMTSIYKVVAVIAFISNISIYTIMIELFR